MNGRIVPLRLLSTLSQNLVDIHGQNQHLSLLRVREHIDILDKYGGLWQLRAEVAEGVRQLTDIRRELDRLRENDAEVTRRVDFLRYQVSEISSANLRPTEYEDLTLERDRVANAERIITLCDHAYKALYDGLDRRESVMDLIGQVSKDLSQLEQLDPSLRENLESADALMHQVDELARALRSYRDDIEYSPERLEELEERLDLINRLRRKYGSTIGEILAFGERASQELEELNHREERAEELKAQEMDLRRQVGQLAGRLSEARQHAARAWPMRSRKRPPGWPSGMHEVIVEIRQSDSEDGVPVGTSNGVPRATTSSSGGVCKAPRVQ